MNRQIGQITRPATVQYGQNPNFITPAAKQLPVVSLFVGDLSIVCTEEYLRDLIGTFIDPTHISSIYIIRCNKTNISLCYGFITITTNDYMEDTAILCTKLNGYYVLGRKMKIRPTTESAELLGEVYDKYIRENADAAADSRISLYLKFHCTHESNNDCVNEENIRSVFEHKDDDECINDNGSVFNFDKTSAESATKPSGGSRNILDVSIRKLATDKITGIQHGYGFVFYENNPVGVQAAVDALEKNSTLHVYLKDDEEDANGVLKERYPIVFSLQPAKELVTSSSTPKKTPAPQKNMFIQQPYVTNQQMGAYSMPNQNQYFRNNQFSGQYGNAMAKPQPYGQIQQPHYARQQQQQLYYQQNRQQHLMKQAQYLHSQAQAAQQRQYYQKGYQSQNSVLGSGVSHQHMYQPNVSASMSTPASVGQLPHQLLSQANRGLPEQHLTTAPADAVEDDVEIQIKKHKDALEKLERMAAEKARAGIMNISREVSSDSSTSGSNPVSVAENVYNIPQSPVFGAESSVRQHLNSLVPSVQSIPSVSSTKSDNELDLNDQFESLLLHRNPSGNANREHDLNDALGANSKASAEAAEAMLQNWSSDFE